MRRTPFFKVPFHFGPALALIVWSTGCVWRDASLSDAGLLLVAQVAITAALVVLVRWLLSGQVGCASEATGALLIPLGVLWQQGWGGLAPQTGEHFLGPWAGLVIGLIAASTVAWLYLLVRARMLRYGVALALWPLAVFVLAEVGVRNSSLGQAPWRDRDHHDVVWDMERRTNLFGQFDGAKTVTLPRGDVVPIEAAPGVERIIALGSSSTFGVGLADAALAWPAQLAAHLPPDRNEVLNAGLPGYNSYQAAVYLDDILLALKPRLVIFYYGGNEGFGSSAKVVHRRAREIVANVDSAGMSHAQAVERRRAAFRYGTSNRPAIWAGELLDRSQLLLGYRNWLLKVKRNLLRPEPQEVARQAEALSRTPPTSEDVLRSMATSLEKIGATLVLTPELIFVPGHRRTAYWGTMEKVAERAPNAYLVDAMPMLEGESPGRFFLDSSHLSPRGCRALGRFLATELTARGLLSTPR